MAVRNLYESIVGSNSSGIESIILNWAINKAENGNIDNAWMLRYDDERDKFKIKKESDGKYSLYIDNNLISWFSIEQGEQLPEWMSKKYIEKITHLIIPDSSVSINLKDFKSLDKLTIRTIDWAKDSNFIANLPNLSKLNLRYNTYVCSKPKADLRLFDDPINKLNRFDHIWAEGQQIVNVDEMIIGEYMPSFTALRCKKMVIDFANRHSLFSGMPELTQCIIDNIEIINAPEDAKINKLILSNCKFKAEDLSRLSDLGERESSIKIDTQTKKRSGLLNKKGIMIDILGQPIREGDVIAVADANTKGRFGMYGIHIEIHRVEKLTDVRVKTDSGIYEPGKVLVLDKEWVKNRDIKNILKI